MKKFNALPALRARSVQAALAVAAMVAASGAHAAGIDDLFAEVDLSGIATKVTALAVLIVGIALVMKGPAIVKRIIAKI